MCCTQSILVCVKISLSADLQTLTSVMPRDACINLYSSGWGSTPVSLWSGQRWSPMSRLVSAIQNTGRFILYVAEQILLNRSLFIFIENLELIVHSNNKKYFTLVHK